MKTLTVILLLLCVSLAGSNAYAVGEDKYLHFTASWMSGVVASAVVDYTMPDASQVEGFIGYVNTPIGGGYSRVRIAERFGQALEYVAANFGSPNADLVRVEWPLEFNEETQTQPVYEPITFDVEQTDMDGVVTIHQQTVGTII